MLTAPQFARMAGISVQGVYAAINSGRLIKVDRHIDETSKISKDFIKTAVIESAKHKQIVTQARARAKGSEGGGPTKQDLEIQRLTQVVRQLELKNNEREGDLISRSFVKKYIFDQVSTAHQRILVDGVKSLSALVHPAVLGGATVEEVEATMRKTLSSFLQACNEQMIKVIKKKKNVDMDPDA